MVEKMGRICRKMGETGDFLVKRGEMGRSKRLNLEGIGTRDPWRRWEFWRNRARGEPFAQIPAEPGPSSRRGTLEGSGKGISCETVRGMVQMHNRGMVQMHGIESGCWFPNFFFWLAIGVRFRTVDGTVWPKKGVWVGPPRCFSGWLGIVCVQKTGWSEWDSKQWLKVGGG